MCIFLYLYFEIKRLPRYPHLSSLQHEIEPPLSAFLLYRAFLAKERNLMHRNILLRVSYLLQHAATHLLSTDFQRYIFTIETDTTKSLRLRGIRVLDATSRREETKANGTTKRRQISKTWKKSFKKSLLVGIKIFFSRNVIALCVDLDEKIKKKLLWPL